VEIKSVAATKGDVELSASIKYGIGRRENGSQYTDGAIDEVKIYNYVRTQKQIIEDMNASHPTVGSPVGSTIGWWKFDEGYGTTANDSSPQDNDGTITGADWTNSGKLSKALNFNGSSDYVDLGTDSSLNFTSSNFSIGAWIKINDTISGSANYMIVNKGAISTDGYTFRINGNAAGGSITFITSQSGAFQQTNSAATEIQSGNWYHVVVVRNGSSAKVYKNGIDVTSSAGTHINPTSTSANAYIGQRGSTDWFKGIVDEVKIYPFALTQDEVLADMNFGKAAVFGATSTASDGSTADWSAAREYCIPGDTSTCNAPKAEWKLDENTGTSTAYDTSGNGNTGTLNSMTESSWISGKIGSALTFDGSADYINIANESNFDFDRTDAFSTEAWIKVTDDEDNGFIVAKQVNSSPHNGFQFYVRTLDDFGENRLAFRLESTSNGDELEVSGSTDLVDNNWHHVAATYAGTSVSSGVELYVDGIQETKTVQDETISTTILNNVAVELGSRGSGTAVQYTGDMDQVRIYDYARTPAQIAWSYNRGKPTGWWRLDENTDTTAYDASGNSNDGTMTNMDADTDWVAGKRNYGLDFDGTDDVVTVTNASEIDFDEALQNGVTFMGWVNVDSDGENNTGEIFDKGTNTYCRTDSESASKVDLECKLDLATADASLNISAALDINTWYHVAMVYEDDADDEITIYINGSDRGSSTDGNGAPASTDTNNLSIGGDTSNNFDGTLDDIRVYNYPLTARQIKEIFSENAIRFGPASGVP